MKKLTLNVPENREEEFSQKLGELMKECGVTVQYEAKEGDFVAFKDDSSEKPFIGIFASFYADGKDKICCFAHINDEGKYEAEEEYWNADEMRPATSKEKEALLRELANANKRWNEANNKLLITILYKFKLNYLDFVMELYLFYLY